MIFVCGSSNLLNFVIEAVIPLTALDLYINLIRLINSLVNMELMQIREPITTTKEGYSAVILN